MPLGVCPSSSVTSGFQPISWKFGVVRFAWSACEL